MSGRVEKFRQIRQIRRKYAVSVIFFFSLLLSGIIATDCSVNGLINNEKGLGIISVKPVEESAGQCYEVWFMNRKYVIDMTYINRDIQRIRELLDK